MSEHVDLRRASAHEVVAAMEVPDDLSNVQLKQALANAFERIASLESDREELGRMMRWLHQKLSSAD